MLLRSISITTCVLFVLAVSILGWSQATVDESLETAYIYVDAASGSDLNPGTQTLPLKSVGAAAQRAETNNRNNVGTRVIINPGTYRESITLASTRADTSLPITFQAATS